MNDKPYSLPKIEPLTQIFKWPDEFLSIPKKCLNCQVMHCKTCANSKKKEKVPKEEWDKFIEKRRQM